jgi:predicted nucleotidyltransferase
VVCLFGSVARGDANDASDIDLLVLGSDPDLSPSALLQELPDELRSAKWSLVYFTTDKFRHILKSASPFIRHLRLEAETLYDPDEIFKDLLAATDTAQIDPAKELRIRLAQLPAYDDLDVFKGDFLYPLSHLYSIAKSIVMLELVVEGVPEFNRDAAFTKFAKRHPDMEADVTVVARLRPFHLLVTRQASGELPFPSQDAQRQVRDAVDAIRRIASSFRMSHSPGPPPVRPALFLELESYAHELGQGLHKAGDELSSSIKNFCTTFFRQFLQDEVGLEDVRVDRESKAAVVQQRRRLEQEGLTRPVAEVLLTFEDLCDLWPDLNYVVSESSFQRFHWDYLPRLLESVERWSRFRGYADITERVAAAARAFHFRPMNTSRGSDQVDTVRLGPEKTELLRLVELDYQRTADFVSGLMQRQATMRGLAVTVWAAILGIAFDRSLWELGVLTAVSVLVFLFLDSYYTVLYLDAREHGSNLEAITAAYYKSVIRKDSTYILRPLHDYKFGLYGSLRPFHPRQLLASQIRQRVMYRYFYPFLVLAALVATILIAVRPVH